MVSPGLVLLLEDGVLKSEVVYPRVQIPHAGGGEHGEQDVVPSELAAHVGLGRDEE